MMLAVHMVLLAANLGLFYLLFTTKRQGWYWWLLLIVVTVNTAPSAIYLLLRAKMAG